MEKTWRAKWIKGLYTVVYRVPGLGLGSITSIMKSQMRKNIESILMLGVYTVVYTVSGSGRWGFGIADQCS